MRPQERQRGRPACSSGLKDIAYKGESSSPRSARQVADNGVSGVHTWLADRPECRRLFDKLRAADMLTVQWVDRLRRNYDVCATIRAFMDRAVIIRAVINNFTFDGATTDPMQKAVREATGFMAATAQAPAEATKGSQRAGIEHAKGRSDSPYLGHKPAFTRGAV
jgi:putative DNA-invertase from lambdoid prophage Rac